MIYFVREHFPVERSAHGPSEVAVQQANMCAINDGGGEYCMVSC